MADKHFHLFTLGQLALDSIAGGTATRLDLRPRHLTVLVALACSRRPLRREALATMFWGEETDERARHSLSNALSALRALLGPDAITARRDTVGLGEHLYLTTDASEFAAACATGQDAHATELYGGPFLGGVTLPDSPGFERWVSGERARLDRLFFDLCARYVPALLRRGEWALCAELAERWLCAVPQSTVAFTAVLLARSGPGTVSACQTALADHARLIGWLASEYGVRPAAPEVDRLVSELREQLASREGDAIAATMLQSNRSVPTLSSAVTATSSARSNPLEDRARVRSRGLMPALAVALIGLLVVVGVFRRPLAVAAASLHPLVAITSIDNVRGDTALAWLQDGIPQLIADDLAQAGTVEPVAPTRVRELLARRRVPTGTTLSPEAALDVARRLGATWAVNGGLTAGNGLLILDLSVRNVRTGQPIETFSVTARDPVQLGDLAATRLLDMAGTAAGEPGAPPRFAAAAGTINADAFRDFVLGTRAYTEARYLDASEHFDAAIALDSGFGTALRARRIIAELHDDSAIVTRLQRLIDEHSDRLSEFDRLQDQISRSLFDGAVERSELLSERFVQRFPRDPRAYRARATVLEIHGRWLAADSVYARELALDSLAMDGGDGPCAPCDAYQGLSAARLNRGDLDGAESAARRWVALQPSVPAAWDELSIVLQFRGQFDEAINAARRAAALSADPVRLIALGRTLLVARRYAAMDSVVATLRAQPTELARDGVRDLTVTLARERGEFRRASAIWGSGDRWNGLTLVEGDNLARNGLTAEARRLYEWSGHPAGAAISPLAYGPQQARGFAWAHALEADALWRADDTLTLAALTDSVQRVGARSYYGRDWALYHHLAGLLALARGDSADAERELESARWGIAGWTRTVLELAKLRLARGRATDAIATLRDAYAGPLDAMGRYVPRSELDYWMAISFARSGHADSAAIYADRVRVAWANADPVVRSRLATLPGTHGIEAQSGR